MRQETNFQLLSNFLLAYETPLRRLPSEFEGYGKLIGAALIAVKQQFDLLYADAATYRKYIDELKTADAKLAKWTSSEPEENEQNFTAFYDQLEAVQAIKDHGDRNIHYFDGLDLFGPEYADMLPDGLHPNAQGYKVLAQNFSRKVAETLFVPSEPIASR